MRDGRNYVIVDLEATCWEGDMSVDNMETIEIGAVRMDARSLAVTDEFNTFVKPVENPQLSEFCRSLTGIHQHQVDAAPLFKTALGRFLKWAGPERYLFCSWGNYDQDQLQADCRRHSIPFPDELVEHVDLQCLVGDKLRMGVISATEAAERLAIPFEGAVHRGIDDSRNIAKLARIAMREQPFEGVALIDYDPDWPDRFEREIRLLQGLLPADTRFEHVGSTAVSGMRAKTTIDLMFGTGDLSWRDQVVEAMRGAGYRYLGEFGIPDRHFFRKGFPPAVHAHWVTLTSEFWHEQLLFRDYLRAHPDECRRYEAVKRRLAGQFPMDRRGYTLGKSAYIEAVINKARAVT